MAQDNSLLKKVVVANIIAETKDTSTFELQPLDGWQPDYEAGQFITLVFNNGLHEDRRSYSFSSAPLLGEPMRITVKRVENGEYSRYMLDHIQKGDILLTSGISGRFTLPAETQVKQLFFIAAGSGITPVFSLLKTALQTTLLPVTLIYSNRTIGDTIFFNRLVALKEAYGDRLHIEFLYSTHADIKQKRLSNWLLLQLLPLLVKSSLRDCLFYICGPFDYMQMITITLLTEGTPKENIRKENFSTLPPVIKNKPPDTDAHNVEIHINHQSYNVAVQYPHSILAAAKAKGIVLPYSCEAGRCGSCAATCTEGKVWMAYNEVLVDEETEQGRILTCQGYPVSGDVKISF
ncbi:MAG: ferredoxin--NADP reductase [Filimonas sp.]|nr:ferredoxin--NADP reductase [Filimonas sp.]